MNATQNRPEFIEIADLIAAFGNEGTLGTEQSFVFRLIFAIDRVKELAPEYPGWKDQQPYKAIQEYNLPYSHLISR